MATNIFIGLLLLSLLALKGETSPRSARSVTTSGSEENSSNTSAVATTEDADCASSGKVTVNNYVQGGREGVAGPQGEMGRIGPPGLTGPPGPQSGGVSFTRWGRTTCPNTEGMEKVYEGTMAGSGYDEAGSTEYLCLHEEPQFLNTNPGLQFYRGRLYGTKYEVSNSPPAFGNMFRHDAPCAVCYTPTRNTKITIPARTSCPPSWTMEYYGYYMSGLFKHSTHFGRAPVCVDVNSESVPGSASARHDVKSLLYFLETTCSGIHCPPYSEGAELSCVVCTK